MSSGILEDYAYIRTFVIFLIAAVILSLALFTIVIPPSYPSGQQVYANFGSLTDDLALTGHVSGYTGIPVARPNGTSILIPDHPSGLASVQLTVRLASLRTNWQPGSGDDLTKARVVITTPDRSETVPFQNGGPKSPPGWIIWKKTGILPGVSANANNILEPNEAFTLIATPSTPIPPGTPFFVTVSVPYAKPLTVSRTVPRLLQPSMDLG